MKRVLVKVVKEIEQIAKETELTEAQLLEEINIYFKKKKKKTIVKLYTKKRKRKINVLDICEKYNMSSKSLYKILKEHDVDLNRKNQNTDIKQ